MAVAALWVGIAASGASGQTVQRDPALAPSAQCVELLGALNRELAARQPEALFRASNLHESGQCVERSDARALEFLAQAARSGSASAVRRMSRRFALGQGVPQSYSNAGAWLAGKGASNEPLQPWDYSIGYAFAVLSEVLSGVQYPLGLMQPPLEASFVLEVDALRVRQLSLRPTADDAVARADLYAALAAAMNARVPDVLKALAPPDPKLLVNARVAMVVGLRYKREGALDVLEDEPILK